MMYYNNVEFDDSFKLLLLSLSGIRHYILCILLHSVSPPGLRAPDRFIILYTLRAIIIITIIFIVIVIIILIIYPTSIQNVILL